MYSTGISGGRWPAHSRSKEVLPDSSSRFPGDSLVFCVCTEKGTFNMGASQECDAFPWVQLGSRIPALWTVLEPLSGVRATEPSRFMAERVGIEPTPRHEVSGQRF